MEKRKIGNLEVSIVGMGTMAFSHGYGKIPEEKYSIEAIQNAYEHGCTFYDTAEVYGLPLHGMGHNERIVGKALEKVRDKVVIATKFFIKPEEYKEDLYSNIKKHLNESLKNLRTTYIDLYYLHRTNPEVPIEEIAKMMQKFIDEGLIKGWGLSQVSYETLKTAHEITPVTAIQSLYNVFERDLEKDIIPYCLKNNIGVVPFSPTASGLVSGKINENTQFEKEDDVRNWVPQLTKENIIGNKPIVDLIGKYAQKLKCTNAQASMAWMIYKYPNCVPIPGSKNKERIIENLDSGKVKFTKELFEEFENELNKLKVFGHRGHVEDSTFAAKVLKTK